MEYDCRICHAKGAGFHFGVITCEGCKSFFVRECKQRDDVTLPKQVMPICKRSGYCQISESTRRTCKSCRWNKCVQSGMSHSKIRFGRPSVLNKSFMVKKRQKKKHSQKTSVGTSMDQIGKTRDCPILEQEESYNQNTELTVDCRINIFDNEFLGSSFNLDLSQPVSKCPTRMESVYPAYFSDTTSELHHTQDRKESGFAMKESGLENPLTGFADITDSSRNGRIKESQEMHCLATEKQKTPPDCSKTSSLPTYQNYSEACWFCFQLTCICLGPATATNNEIQNTELEPKIKVHCSFDDFYDEMNNEIQMISQQGLLPFTDDLGID